MGLIPREDIYPTQQSQLEILLDGYFMQEDIFRGTQWLKSIDMIRVNFEPPPEGVEIECFLDGTPGKLPSWEEAGDPLWRSLEGEDWKPTEALPLVTIHADEDLFGLSLAAAIQLQLADHLAANAGLRSSPVNWQIEDEADEDEGAFPSATQAMRTLWNGLRPWPFSDSDLAQGMGIAVAAAKAADGLSLDFIEGVEAKLEEFLGRLIEIEFHTVEGTYSRSYAAADDLRACMRSDILDLLAPTWREQIAGPHNIIQMIQAPDRLYEFDAVSSLFARQIAPLQVVMRGGKAKLYNPALFKSLGLP